MYYSLFESNPQDGKPRQNGWKTVYGWNYEAKKLTSCLKANARIQQYEYHATVNINNVLTVEEHKKVWAVASRALRQSGVIAFYIREADTQNHINYHFIIAAPSSKGRFKKCFEAAFQQQQLEITITIAEIMSIYGIVDYITKYPHRYRHMRVYFSKNCTLSKHGTIGKFWLRQPKQIWKDVIQAERQISAATKECTNIHRAAKYLSALTDGYIPFRRIRRSLALAYPANEKILSDLAGSWLAEYS